MTEAAQIWNRAACESGGSAPRAGDAALAAMLTAHGLVMNGGVFHAVELLGTDALQRSCAGYVFFGFEALAAVLLAAGSAEQNEEAESEADHAYWAHAPNDGVLYERFLKDFVSNPDQYAPM